jgi:hypothetical protein
MMQSLTPLVRMLSILPGLALLGACAAPGPTVRSDAAPGFALSGYRSYGYVEPVSYDKAGYSSITSGHVRTAIARELERRGLRPGSPADLLVNFDVRTADKLKQGVQPSVGVSYGSWGGLGLGIGLGTGGTRSVTEGTLTIDLVDRARNQMVWSGSVSGELSKTAVEQPQPAIDAAVRRVFERLPADAPSSAGAAP